MRDLGQMGESAFSHWCAEVGLKANGSIIDKTGWDFLVEFDFESGLSAQEVHSSACECKVQVKSTDRVNRSVPVKLSNLRRLATAQMPAFFVFIEFDGENSAQRVYVVHVDELMIEKVLKKLHQLEHDRNGEVQRLNRKTMNIGYAPSHLVKEISGENLKESFLAHIGNDYAGYIFKKNEFLKSTGYENGYGNVTISVEGEENFNAWIDASLGLENTVDISEINGFESRFGIASGNDYSNLGGDLKLAMPGVKPKSVGKVRFRKDKLSVGLSFDAELYISQFNSLVSAEHMKARVKTSFFDLIFNPSTGQCNIKFSLCDIRLEIKEFRNAISLMNMLGGCEDLIYIGMFFDDISGDILKIQGKENTFNFQEELHALDTALKLIVDFDIADTVDVSFDEVVRYKKQICEMNEILGMKPGAYKMKVCTNESFEEDKEIACVTVVASQIGSHVFGMILVMIGRLDTVLSSEIEVLVEKYNVEKRFVFKVEDRISNEDILYAVKSVESAYCDEYSVISTFG